MRQRLISVVTLAIIVLCTTTIFAHDKIRIVGTISKCDQTTLTVKSVEGETVSIMLAKQTLVYRDKKKVASTSLKIGLTVVVDALFDWMDGIQAVEISIVPAIKPSAGK